MNSTPPPNLPDQPSVFRRYGCLIILVALATMVVVAVMLGMHALVGTSMPYRMIASVIEKANPNVKIEGIIGDLKTGFGVASISWGDDPANRSEILDLRVKYNGYSDLSKTRRVVIHDAGVRKAHIDLADLPSSPNGTASQTTTYTTGSGTTSVTTTTTASGSTSTSTTTTTNVFPSTLDSFEIEHVDIEDVLITKRLSNFRLSIPKIEWTDFKATPTSFDPGVLTVESDRLMLHTTVGRTVHVEGQDMAFQKMLTGTVQPALHPAIKQPIVFTADLSFLPQGGEVRPFHLVTADDKLEIDGAKDGGGSVHVRQLDLAAFIDPRKIFGDHAADLPSDLILSAVAISGFSDGNGTIKIVGGSFHLGASTFQIEPVEFSKEEQSGAILQAVLKTDAGIIVWALPLANFGQEYHPHFICPGLAPSEILAHVFAGRYYGELNAEEKQAIDAKLPAYFSSAGK